MSELNPESLHPQESNLESQEIFKSQLKEVLQNMIDAGAISKARATEKMNAANDSETKLSDNTMADALEFACVGVVHDDTYHADIDPEKSRFLSSNLNNSQESNSETQENFETFKAQLKIVFDNMLRAKAISPEQVESKMEAADELKGSLSDNLTEDALKLACTGIVNDDTYYADIDPESSRFLNKA